jgi:hypothetical protein
MMWYTYDAARAVQDEMTRTGIRRTGGLRLVKGHRAAA